MAISSPPCPVDVAEPVEPPPRRRASIANTNATRHLSAGAYLDPEFCLTALREIYYKPKRIVAPSYGFDPITVLGHCLRARRALLVRDALLVGVLLLASWVSVVAVAVVLLTLLAVHAVLVAGRVGRDSVRYLREPPNQSDSADDEDDPRRRILRRSRAARSGDKQQWSRGFRRLWLENVLAQIAGRLIGVVFAYVVFLAAGTGLATLVWHAGLLGRTRLGVTPTAAVGILVGLVFVIPALARGWCRYQIRALVPGHTPHPPVRTRRLAEIAGQGGGNTVVYSGYQPFVGSGIVLRRWNLTQRLVRPAPVTRDPKTPVESEAEREFRTPPFRAREISEYVRDHIAGLAHDPLPERHLADLTVDDRIFVAGTEITDLRPYTTPEQVARVIRHPTAPQRHYVACQIVSWRGELVTTVYVHFAVQGKVLYVELHVTGLLPCDERYRVVDQLDGTSLSQVLRDAGSGLLSAPTVVAGAPTGFLRGCADALGLAFAGPAKTFPDHPQRRRGRDGRRHRQRQRRRRGHSGQHRGRIGVMAPGDTTNIGAYATTGGTVNVSGNAVGTANYAPARRPAPRPRPRSRVDIGILTVLTEELQAVVEVLERYPNYRIEQLPHGAEAHLAEVPAGDGPLRVVAVQTLAPGPRSAAVAFQQLQEAYQPPIVLLVGIAGGIRPGLAIGDVVIGEEVVYYDARRETPEGPARRGQSQPMSPVLRHRLNAFFRRYGTSIAISPGEAVRLYRGPIGSGDAVVTDADSDIIAWLRRFNEKILAVETEAGGVGQAFYEHVDEDRTLTGWLTIRGISDLADRHKGHDRHRFASDRAALVMDRLLPLLKLPAEGQP